MKSSTLFTFAAAAGLASAQSLSTDCTNSLKGLLTSPEAACLNPSALLSFFVGNAQSVPDTVNNWLTGLCSTGSCSNETLANVVTNITTGCASDFNVAGGVPETVTQIVQEVYPTAPFHRMFERLCVSETLTSLETLVGKLSFSDFNVASAFGDFQKILVGAKNLACTGCTKAAFRLASQLSLVSEFPQAEQQVALQIDAICGANFIESSSSDTDDNVQQTAVNEVFTSTKSNSALSLTISKVAGASILFFFSAFTLLG
ncbi:hypothetical protein B0H14DRAFT_3422619 [Mycena olivaceomarginata]|nr:hypothetical protein B0H14DRAFT_3422619 [Mycena olivaceomarginata]